MTLCETHSFNIFFNCSSPIGFWGALLSFHLGAQRRATLWIIFIDMVRIYREYIIAIVSIVNHKVVDLINFFPYRDFQLSLWVSFLCWKKSFLPKGRNQVLLDHSLVWIQKSTFYEKHLSHLRTRGYFTHVFGIPCSYSYTVKISNWKCLRDSPMNP